MNVVGAVHGAGPCVSSVDWLAESKNKSGMSD